MRETFNINIVNFFIVPRMKKWDMHRYLSDIEAAARKEGKTAENLEWDAVEKGMKEWRKNKSIEITKKNRPDLLNKKNRENENE
mgnify:CR=1 FL=1